MTREEAYEKAAEILADAILDLRRNRRPAEERKPSPADRRAA